MEVYKVSFRGERIEDGCKMSSIKYVVAENYEKAIGLLQDRYLDITLFSFVKKHEDVIIQGVD